MGQYLHLACEHLAVRSSLGPRFDVSIDGESDCFGGATANWPVVQETAVSKGTWSQRWKDAACTGARLGDSVVRSGALKSASKREILFTPEELFRFGFFFAATYGGILLSKDGVPSLERMLVRLIWMLTVRKSLWWGRTCISRDHVYDLLSYGGISLPKTWSGSEA